MRFLKFSEKRTMVKLMNNLSHNLAGYLN